MNEHGITDPYDVDRIRSYDVIDLPTIQKKLNLHYTLFAGPGFGQGSVDRMPPMPSTPASRAATSEHRIDDDHMLKDDTYVVWDLENGKPGCRRNSRP